MTALATLCAGLLVATACWHWAGRDASSAVRMSVVAVLGVSATVFNVIVPMFNVEATTTAVLCTGIVLGARTGALVGIVAVIGTSVTGGIGVWTLWQIVAFTGVAIAGAVLGRTISGDDWTSPARRGLIMISAAVVTVVYDALVTVPTIALFGSPAGGSLLNQVLAALLVGAPFTFVHVVSNVVLVAVIAPPLLGTLSRCRLRLSEPSIESDWSVTVPTARDSRVAPAPK